MRDFNRVSGLIFLVWVLARFEPATGGLQETPRPWYKRPSGRGVDGNVSLLVYIPHTRVEPVSRARCLRRATLSVRTPGDVARRERAPRWRLEWTPRIKARPKFGAKRTSRARRPLTTCRRGVAPGVDGPSHQRENKRGGGAPRDDDAHRSAWSVDSTRGRGGASRRADRRSLRWGGGGPWENKARLAKPFVVHLATRETSVGGDEWLNAGGTENAWPSREGKQGGFTNNSVEHSSGSFPRSLGCFLSGARFVRFFPFLRTFFMVDYFSVHGCSASSSHKNRTRDRNGGAIPSQQYAQRGAAELT